MYRLDISNENKSLHVITNSAQQAPERKFRKENYYRKKMAYSIGKILRCEGNEVLKL